MGGYLSYQKLVLPFLARSQNVSDCTGVKTNGAHEKFISNNIPEVAETQFYAADAFDRHNRVRQSDTNIEKK